MGDDEREKPGEELLEGREGSGVMFLQLALQIW